MTNITESAPMNLREYWDAVGTENIRKIVHALGSSMAYARLLRYGSKVAGRKFALDFIAHARRITPGWEPDLELMLRGTPKPSSGRGKIIQPSAEFLASQVDQQDSQA